MGWQDRDWAKLNEQELAQIYGGRGRRTPRVREGAATAIVVSALATLVLGRAHLLPFAARGSSYDPVYPQHIIYGIRGTAAGKPNDPGGTNTACTTASLAANQAWQCQAWAVDVARYPIVAPGSYDGTCPEAKVDQASGRWLCISPAPTGQEPTPSLNS